MKWFIPMLHRAAILGFLLITMWCIARAALSDARTNIGSMTLTNANSAGSLSALLNEVSKVKPDALVMDMRGGLVELTLEPRFVSDENLVLISNCSSLQKLTLFGSDSKEVFSSKGIQQLSVLTNLHTLTLMCGRRLKPGVLEAITTLTNLSALALLGTDPEIPEFQSLTRMTNLAELRVAYAMNLGDGDLASLTNIPFLRRIEFRSAKLTTNSLAIIPKFSFATNVYIGSQEWRTNRIVTQ